MKDIEDPRRDFAKILSNLHYTHFYLMDKYKKLLAPYDLTPAQSNVLGIVSYMHPDSLSLERVKSLVLEPNSDVSRIVSRLCDKGYLEKVPDRNNRRKVCIRATPRGLKTYSKLNGDGKFLRFTADVTLRDARTLVRVLEKIREAHH